jgi:ADP-ribose pyrophosphatase
MEKIIEEYEITNREVKYNGYFQVEELTIKNNNKEIKREVFKRGNAAAALVYNTETKKYLFVEQYRPGAEGVLVEIVAGGIEEGEKPQDAIKREIAEELGYKVDKLLHITDCYVSPGANSEVFALFYVEVSEKIGEGGGIDDENIKVVEVSDLGLNGNLFFDISDNGDIIPPYKLIDAKSILAVSLHVQAEMMKKLWSTLSDYKMKSL